MVVLHWIVGNGQYGQLVASRVQKILSKRDKVCEKYTPKQSLVQRWQWIHFFRRLAKLCRHWSLNHSKLMQFLLGFSTVFQRGRDKVYNADKFVKQFGQFVYQNNCTLRQFGWQLSVSINTVINTVIFFLSTLRWKTLGEIAKSFSFACNWTVNFDILIPHARLKNDWFWGTRVGVWKT